MSRPHHLLFAALVLALCAPAPASAADCVVTTPVTWNGTHLCDDLTVTQYGSITHSPGSSLTILVSGHALIQGDVDVSGKGYGADGGPGAGAQGWYGHGAGGGGHCGLGGVGSTGNGGGGAYGSFVNPTQPGSGGGSNGGSVGGKGGGVLKLIVAGTLTLDGDLRADGDPGQGNSWHSNAGGGAGGSLWVEAHNWAGGGLLSARGGDGPYNSGSHYAGGGAGGRISAFYAVDQSTIQVDAAAGGHNAGTGGAGALYQIKTGEEGEIWMTNHGRFGATTPLNGTIPAQMKRVMVHAGARLHVPLHRTLTVDELDVKWGGQLIGGGTITAGDLLVDADSSMTHFYDRKLTVTVTGDATIDGLIDVSGMGSGPGSGSGYGHSGGYGNGAGGGGHGGRGGAGQQGVAGGGAYGSLTAPDAYGSGGGNNSSREGGRGGGAAHLIVGGVLTLDGTIRADGLDGAGDSWHTLAGGGAGGSVWLEVGTFAGAGAIEARGGMGAYNSHQHYAGSGGGGQVAVIYDLTLASVSYAVHGGHRPLGSGGAGTVFKRQASQDGTLIVDNGGTTGALTTLDRGPSYYQMVMVQEHAWLHVVDGFTLASDGVTVRTGGVLLLDHELSCDDLSVGAEGAITHSEGEALVVDVANQAMISGTIDVSYRGCAGGGGAAPGAGGHYGDGAGGAAHGGNGGKGSTGLAGGWGHDALAGPTLCGSGGGNNGDYQGGRGGGVLRLIVGGTLWLNGSLRADGAQGAGNSWHTLAGGGAGGAIWVTAGTFRGVGEITARGGQGAFNSSQHYAGSGGGGRVAVHAGAYINGASYDTSGGGGSGAPGGAGTVYIVRGGANPDLIVDNEGIVGAATPMASPATWAFDDLRVRGGAVFYAPDEVRMSAATLSITDGGVFYLDEAFTVANLSIGDTGTLTHTVCNALDVHVTGDAAVSGAVDVSGKGCEDGPGQGSDGAYGQGAGGGAHGGHGSAGNGHPGGLVNGSFVEPALHGSNGGDNGTYAGGRGGGVLRLIVDGALHLDGGLYADGRDGSGNSWHTLSGGGAGGSIWVDAGAFTGDGIMRASGGTGAYNSHTNFGGSGSGGRVALYYGTAQSNVVFEARGGGYTIAFGGAGTAFLKPFDGPGRLYVDNGGLSGERTPLLPETWSGEWTRLSVTGHARLHVGRLLYVSIDELIVHSGGELSRDGFLEVGSLTVGADGVVTHDPGKELFLLVSGDAAVNGALDVTAKGYPASNGYGQGQDGWYGGGGGGGGHGGDGHHGSGGAVGGHSYGAMIYLDRSGSGGGSNGASAGGAGGGTLRMVVLGDLSLDGVISSDGGHGAGQSWHTLAGGGAGGSLWLYAQTLDGVGHLSAIGGDGAYNSNTNYGGGGGGGRISVCFIEDNSAVTWSADGGGQAVNQGQPGSLHQYCASGACAPFEDEYEPNDTFAAATPIDDDVLDLHACPGDADYWAISLQQGHYFQGRVRYPHLEGALALTLYAPDGTALASSDLGAGDEQVSWAIEQAGTYYLGVLMSEERGQTPGCLYDLELALLPPLGEPCEDDADCGSGDCVDGVCCDGPCDDLCEACDLPALAGHCSPILDAEDPAGCFGDRLCDEQGECRLKLGVPCVDDGDCASDFCADGVCCAGRCDEVCHACDQAGQAGACLPVTGGQDPDTCAGEFFCDDAGDCVSESGSKCEQLGYLGGCAELSEVDFCSSDFSAVHACVPVEDLQCLEEVAACDVSATALCCGPDGVDATCVDLGHEDFCAARVVSGSACGHEQSDCDGDEECKGELTCLAPEGPMGGVDGCCFEGEAWGGDACFDPEPHCPGECLAIGTVKDHFDHPFEEEVSLSGLWKKKKGEEGCAFMPELVRVKGGIASLLLGEKEKGCAGLVSLTSSFYYGVVRASLQLAPVPARVELALIAQESGERVSLIVERGLLGDAVLHAETLGAGQTPCGSPTHACVGLPWDPADAFHDYGFDFHPGRAVFLVDGEPLAQLVAHTPTKPGVLQITHRPVGVSGIVDPWEIGGPGTMDKEAALRVDFIHYGPSGVCEVCEQCGNEIVSGGEPCDGARLMGERCQSQGYEQGELACSELCAFDLEGCYDVACGDGICHEAHGEDCASCPEDCDPCCGDGACTAAHGETCFTCEEDCEECCGNGACEQAYGEDCETCEGDCGPCPPDCGDESCDATLGEDCASCPDDCGLCCGDGVCDVTIGEQCGSCPEDCPCGCGEVCQGEGCVFIACEGSQCGDDGCGGSCGDCPAHHDCDAGSCVYVPWCGDGVCDDGEDCASCAADCGCGCGETCASDGCVFTACEGLQCGADGCGGSCGDCPEHYTCEAGACVFVPWCGDGTCGDDEDCASCASDCGCGCGETCAAAGCVFTACDGLDCGGDGCGGSCGECPEHHGCEAGACVYVPWCGDGTCDAGEDCGGCADDCGCGCGELCQVGGCVFTACDDLECGGDGCGGSCGACPEHHACVEGLCVYLSYCGDGTCDGDEDCASCAEDCGACCGDGSCDAAQGEDCTTCAADCGCGCGEVCEAGGCVFTACEGLACGDDGCGGSCGDCPEHHACVAGACVFVSWCGDGACDDDEDCASCAEDCGECCGDGVCDEAQGEDCDACAEDCGCGCGEVCEAGGCVFTACEGLACGEDSCGGSCGECLAHHVCEAGACVYTPWCGDYVCGEGEDCSSCPLDCVCGCGESCAAGACVFTACEGMQCGEDGCGGSCGDCPEHHVCTGGACVHVPFCGDGACDEGEDCVSCTEDCGDCCGDGACDASLSEDCDTCAEDCACGCGEVCEEGACVFTACEGLACGEDGCGGSCGDCPAHHVCEAGACVYDPWCGDYVCDAAEDCASCPLDCVCGCGEACVSGACVFSACEGLACGDDGCGGSCGDCPEHHVCEAGACVYVASCGDETCDADETCASCAEDCGDCCGDGACDAAAGETCETCAADCGGCPPECGDGTCDEDESCVSCPEDCSDCCGDGVCDAAQGEDCATCDDDCACACGEACAAGACVFTACEGLECGDDGCGASCGECAADKLCVDGICVWEADVVESEDVVEGQEETWEIPPVDIEDEDMSSGAEEGGPGPGPGCSTGGRPTAAALLLFLFGLAMLTARRLRGILSPRERHRPHRA